MGVILRALASIFALLLGWLHPKHTSQAPAPTAIYFEDTVTGTQFALTVDSGALTLSPTNGASPVSTICMVDAVSGTQMTLSVQNAALTQATGPCSNAAVISLKDTATGTEYALTMNAAAFTSSSSK